MEILFNIAISFVTAWLACAIRFYKLVKKLDKSEANYREEMLKITINAVSAAKRSNCCKCCTCNKN